MNEPESGASTYSYGYSGTAGLGLTVTRVRPQANQTGSAQTTTTSQYDALGRLVSVNYTDGTPNRAYYYDTNIYWSQIGGNLKGRLATTGGGTGATWNGSSIGYDVMGRVNQMWQCGPATCGTGYQAARPLSFAYDWVGNLTQVTDNVSGTITYGRSIAGEVTSITNGTYTNLPYNPPNLVSNVVNGPYGPISYTLGNGLNIYRTYDTLTRPAAAFVCNGPAANSCSGGTQVYGTFGQWKGTQLQYLSDTLLNQQITYGYGDGFNRLTARTVTSGTVNNYTYGYDRYGNRTSQTALQSGYNFLPTINAANNHITTSGYAYDAAGNMTNDTVHSYTYDAEGNITKVDGGSTASYVYDVFNHRVHVQTASATTEYVYDLAGRRISSWQSPNNYGNEGRIYWDGQQVAYRSTDGTTYFDHQDTLGTERMRTNYAGAVGSSYKSLPWGDGYTATVNSSGADQDNNHFADLDRDSESGTEHALWRNYASAQGRWLGPDSYLGSYDITNPQSMNRYTYALNNPTSFVDPSGLDPQCSSFDPVTGSFQCDSYYPVNPDPCTLFGGCGGIIPWPCLEFGCGWPGIPPSTWNPATPGEGIAVGDNGPLHLARRSKGPKSSKQKLCEDNLFGVAIVQGIGSALGVGVPGSDPAGDVASAAKSATSSPAFRATAGVIATQLGSTLLTRAGAVRLGALITEEFVPGLGWAASAYIGYSAVRDAMSYYDDNVASCSE